MSRRALGWRWFLLTWAGSFFRWGMLGAVLLACQWSWTWT